MNYPLLAASIVIAGAAFFDGLSTVHFLKNPKYDEQNFLFGKRPSTLRVYLEGALIIGAEIGIGFALSHWHLVLGYLAGASFVVQSFVHVRNGVRNFKLPLP